MILGAGLCITATVLAVSGIGPGPRHSPAPTTKFAATSHKMAATSLVLQGVPIDTLATDGVTLRPPTDTVGALDKATIEKQLVGASPSHVLDAVLAQVTLAPPGSTARQCLCWVVSFQAGQLVMLHGPKGGRAIMLYSYTIVDARTGELVFGRGRAKPAS